MEFKKKTIQSHDGLKLYYETHDGDPVKAKLFFLHGIGGDVDAWNFVRTALLEKGFSSISLDLRGHGYSDHPRSAKSYQINNLVQDVAAIMLAEQAEKIILVGHCYGAVVAAHFAIEHSEKLEKLVLISPTYRAPNYLQAKVLRKTASGLSHLLSSISPKPIRPGHSEYPIGKFHKDYEFYGLVRTILRNSWGSYLLTTKEIIDLDLENNLSKISTPTLVIAGDKDTIFPLPIQQTIHSKIPGAKLTIISGANHVVILNNANEVVTSLVDFLRPL